MKEPWIDSEGTLHVPRGTLKVGEVLRVCVAGTFNGPHVLMEHFGNGREHNSDPIYDAMPCHVIEGGD